MLLLSKSAIYAFLAAAFFFGVFAFLAFGAALGLAVLGFAAFLGDFLAAGFFLGVLAFLGLAAFLVSPPSFLAGAFFGFATFFGLAALGLGCLLGFLNLFLLFANFEGARCTGAFSLLESAILHASFQSCLDASVDCCAVVTDFVVCHDVFQYGLPG